MDDFLRSMSSWKTTIWSKEAFNLVFFFLPCLFQSFLDHLIDLFPTVSMAVDHKGVQIDEQIESYQQNVNRQTDVKARIDPKVIEDQECNFQ